MIIELPSHFGLLKSFVFSVVYEEIREMREICGDKAHLKTILATGELKSVSNIYKASMAAMMAGSRLIHLYITLTLVALHLM